MVQLRKPFDTTRTRREIIGEHPTKAAEDAWSLDTLANSDAPPMILFSASDDPIAPPGHNLSLFQTLLAKGAKAELHIFEEGGHGGIAPAQQNAAAALGVLAEALEVDHR